MDNKWKQTFLLHSQTEEFSEKVKVAEGIITDALKRSSKPYIAFSGGKDSTCMAHLIIRQNPNVMVHHWDYGKYMPRYLEDETIKNARMLGVKSLRVETSEKYNTDNIGPVWYSEFFGRILPQYKKEGFDAVFVGLRGEESSRRRRRLRAGKSLSAMPEIWPLAKWSWVDVWAYTVKHNLPYISVYDIYARVVGWDRVRFSTFFDPEFDKLGCSNLDGMLLWRHRNDAQNLP